VLEAGNIELVVEIGRYDGVGFLEGGHGMCREMILPVQVIKNEFSVVIESQFQVVACDPFDSNRRVG